MFRPNSHKTDQIHIKPSSSSWFFVDFTAAPELECGCYAPNEEIVIENDKCVLNLGSFPDVTGNWSFTFDLKVNSMADDPTDPQWLFYILSVIGLFMT